MAAAQASRSRTLRGDDPDFEKHLQTLLDDEFNSDMEETYETESNHSSDSEQEADADYIPEENNSGDDNGSVVDSGDDHYMNNRWGDRNDNDNANRVPRRSYFYGKNKCFKWRKEQPPVNVRTRRHNIIMQLPGLRQPAKNLGENPEVEAVWKLLFSENVLSEIIQWTNVKISKMRQKYEKRERMTYLHDLDMTELKAFIGLLVFTAIFKSGNESLDSLFATDGTGRDIFRCTMTKNRMLFILAALRFDNSDDREERKKEDPIAAISKIFNMFIENFQQCISLGPTVTVDEMLVPFRGRCSFVMYMPKKPAKYGLKVMCMSDARTHYLYNAYIYCGRGSDSFTLANDDKKLKIPTQAVVRLVKPIQHTRRNVTADNWFGSIELVQQLLARELTFVGTLKKNKPQIPNSFLPQKSRQEKTSVYGFTDEISLVSYVPKKGKAVILVSSMHHSQEDDPETGKPEIISFYNLTKSGVDALDQKCATYTASRRTRRWPMAIFFALVDIVCGVNSYRLYQAFKKTPDVTRLEFMKSLAKALTYPLLKRRLQNKSLPRELTFSIRRILQIPDEEVIQLETTESTFEKRRTCAFCPPKLKRKTKYPCQECGSAICLECARKICKKCFDKRNK